jgi:hypothetical protein
MLTEFKRLRQDKGGYRRLFENEDINLYIWYEQKGGPITGFQLVYFAGDDQKALTWTQTGGYSHNTVDGWDSARFNKTPMLVMDGAFARTRLLDELGPDLRSLEPAIGALVLEKIQDCPI